MKIEYRIKVNYQTGDSFGYNDTEEIIDMGWKNLDIAMENMMNIKTHYENIYIPLNSHYYKRKYKLNDDQIFDNITEKYRDKDFFVLGNDESPDGLDKHYIENCIKLKLDNGRYVQISNFWCGYFETLYSLEIVMYGDNLKVEIDKDAIR